MASFLAPTNNPTFNPYISTENPELYAQLITQKQMQYEQGVQRIQSYIDNVTGLQVGREQDAAYLQGLSDELRTNIEGLNNDFSDPNIIRKAEGFFHNTYNDRKLQGMVMSNMYKQDALQQIEKAKQDGTYANQNADVIYEQIDNWQRGNENATLGKQSYTPWFDYNSGLKEHLESVLPDVRIDNQNMFDKDGNLVAYSLVKNEQVVIPKDKLRSAINTYFSSTPQAGVQLSLDARYSTKGMDNTTALADLNNYYNTRLASVDNQIADIDRRIELEVNRPEAQKVYKDTRAELETVKSNLSKQLATDLESFNADPSSIKRKMYVENLYDQYVNMYGRSEIKQNIVENPTFKGFLNHEKFLEDQRQNVIDNQFNQQKLDLDKEELAYKKENDALNRDLEREKLTAQNSGVSPTILPNDVVSKGSVGQFNGVDITTKDMDAMKSQFRGDLLQQQASMLAEFHRGTGEYHNYLNYDFNTGAYSVKKGQEENFRKALTETYNLYSSGKNTHEALNKYYGTQEVNTGINLEKKMRTLGDNEIYTTYDVYNSSAKNGTWRLPTESEWNATNPQVTGFVMDDRNMRSNSYKDNRLSIDQEISLLYEGVNLTPTVAITKGQKGFTEAKQLVANRYGQFANEKNIKELAGSEYASWVDALKATGESDMGFQIITDPSSGKFKLRATNLVGSNKAPVPIEIEISPKEASMLSGGLTDTKNDPYSFVVSDIRRGNGRSSEKIEYNNSKSYQFKYQFVASPGELNGSQTTPEVLFWIKPSTKDVPWTKINQFYGQRINISTFFERLKDLKNYNDQQVESLFGQQ